MTSQLSSVERGILLAATEGDEPIYKGLRLQVEACTVTSRSFTGVGFFIDLEVDRLIAPAAIELRDFAISDLAASVEGLERGAGFVVFVRDGFLSVLEGFTYDEPWLQMPDRVVVVVSNPRDPIVVR